MRSKSAVTVAAGALMFGIVSIASSPAEAAGCIKGAVVGGVAGHYAGRHAVLGAMGGCVVGRRLAREKAARAQEEERQRAAAYNGDGAQPMPPRPQ